MSRPKLDMKERLAKHSIPEPMSGCILWTGYVGKNGYGTLQTGLSPHRAAYELAKGKIPDGLHIDHLCRVRSCINPDHLEAVSCQENVNRGLNKKRDFCIRGHKLTEDNLFYYYKLGIKKQQRQCKICTYERKLRNFPK